MKPWTDEARRLFADHCEARRRALLDSGADPDEVFGDWRAHVDEDAARRSCETVDAALVGDILGRLAVEPPAAASVGDAGPALSPLARPEPPPKPALSIFATSVIAIFGVFLPALTLVVELFSSMCASAFFDPIPTWINVLLIALVPAANLLSVVALRSSARPAWRLAGWLNGLAVIASGFYALLFAILTPVAVIAIIFFGLGFLPLSPLTSFICALVLRRRMRATARFERRPLPAAIWKPLAVGILLLAAAAGPRLVTLGGLQMAASDDAVQRARGVRMLRTWGNEEELLRRSYLNRGFNADPLLWIAELGGTPVPIEKVREVYYRVTGRPFNAVKPPPLRGRRGPVFDEAEWDFAQGNDQVAARLRGLAMTQSRLDGKVEAAAGLSYVEWTMEFRNDAQIEREARTQILLPPGGVVSRLTLWINGEEREAAFGGRSEVRQAYQQVVARRRDPVLVTTAGPDRVLVQCFPVPANGGRMKVRIGITAPLEPLTASAQRLALPRLIEENFGLAGDLKPSVWIEGDGDVRLPAAGAQGVTGLSVEHPSDGHFAVRGETASSTLEGGACMSIEGPAARTVWCADDRSPGGGLVVQRLVEQAAAAPRALAVAIDGSASMAEHAAEVAAVLATLPKGVPARVFVASDEVIEVACDGAATLPEKYRFAGGCDNVAALVRAWDWAAGQAGGAVLWLHATQPVESGAMESLAQRRERRPDGPAVYACQFGGGPDRVTERLGGSRSFHAVASAGGTAADLVPIFDAWAGRAPTLAWTRERKTSDVPPPADGLKASAHLVRLEVAGEVARLAEKRGRDDRAAAVNLARVWQLVTPVSGAVVLETQAQYRQAGLQDIDPATAPDVIPEPGALALILCAIAVLLAARAAFRNGLVFVGRGSRSA